MPRGGDKRELNFPLMNDIPLFDVTACIEMQLTKNQEEEVFKFFNNFGIGQAICSQSKLICIMSYITILQLSSQGKFSFRQKKIYINS